MSTFKDNAGREWTVRIDVQSLADVRESMGVELGKGLADDCRVLMQIRSDKVVLVKLLYHLAQRPTPTGWDKFCEAMTGDALDRGLEAFEEAFLSFCPRRESEPLREVLQKARELFEAELAARTELAKSFVVGDLVKTSNGSPGDTAESSESVLARAG